jgi:hypothetical protein
LHSTLLKRIQDRNSNIYLDNDVDSSSIYNSHKEDAPQVSIKNEWIIPILGRLRQEDQELESNLGYIENMSVDWVT